jgi:hypothetical protein
MDVDATTPQKKRKLSEPAAAAPTAAKSSQPASNQPQSAKVVFTIPCIATLYDVRAFIHKFNLKPTNIGEIHLCRCTAFNDTSAVVQCKNEYVAIELQEKIVLHPLFNFNCTAETITNDDNDATDSIIFSPDENLERLAPHPLISYIKEDCPVEHHDDLSAFLYS